VERSRGRVEIVKINMRNMKNKRKRREAERDVWATSCIFTVFID
jgi:hypothetical protein